MDLADGDALRLVPTAVRLLTERASHGDWILRSSWLSHLGKSYKHVPGVLLCTHRCGTPIILDLQYSFKTRCSGAVTVDFLGKNSTFVFLSNYKYSRHHMSRIPQITVVCFAVLIITTPTCRNENMNFPWSGLSSTLDPETVCFLILPDPALVQVEAGNRALKAVFGSKLAAKGKSLAELLQPHSIGKLCACLVLLLKNIASESNIGSKYRNIQYILCII